MVIFMGTGAEYGMVYEVGTEQELVELQFRWFMAVVVDCVGKLGIGYGDDAVTWCCN
ncbi:hypothetical protein MKX03_006500 [Papaver bracteatum]|nr:hypothetical protein MKX03_006500 [Papaver bracteatum]